VSHNYHNLNSSVPTGAGPSAAGGGGGGDDSDTTTDSETNDSYHYFPIVDLTSDNTNSSNANNSGAGPSTAGAGGGGGGDDGDGDGDGDRYNRYRSNDRYNGMRRDRAAYNDNNEPFVLRTDVGDLTVLCQHCNALKFSNERPGICCSNGKVDLNGRLPKVPDILQSLMCGQHPQSAHYIKHIRKYNSLFQFTSFGANIIHQNGWNPTLRVQGQTYHQYGPLLNNPEQEAQFMQIYFLSPEQQLTRRSTIYEGLNGSLILNLQNTMEHNIYVRQFKTAAELLRNQPHTNLKVFSELFIFNFALLTNTCASY